MDKCLVWRQLIQAADTRALELQKMDPGVSSMVKSDTATR